ncbi:MAG: hypothetical protein HN742_11150 [Lentisphaerae bacterium]|jgi:hypothetical protein|nr:hypothetical protein [Lentisphaerota bacterium]MBT4816098.1 hypothetical protein [Lentisphaerota bacterium]MBT5610510.1 hypothetical protein [Lentisphaerota bacterium]MBT7056065.1 hypothetical protein [Lentisphaerota bacterium]MBT7842422.1 hypothetical protein [Lentisphaerota bacterium]
MKQQTQHTYQGIVVPVFGGLRLERNNGYGSVPGIPDWELADPEELERQVLKDHFALLNCIPFSTRRGVIRPTVMGDGSLDWGAFGTVDFDRLRPRLDRTRREVAELRDELRHALIMFDIINDRIGHRITSKAKYAVLRYVRTGTLSLQDILDSDMCALAKWYARARNLRSRIKSVTESKSRSRSVATVK